MDFDVKPHPLGVELDRRCINRRALNTLMKGSVCYAHMNKQLMGLLRMSDNTVRAVCDAVNSLGGNMNPEDYK